jgi:hypothetical protein
MFAKAKAVRWLRALANKRARLGRESWLWSAGARPQKRQLSRASSFLNALPIPIGERYSMPLLSVDPPGKKNVLRVQLDGNTAARLRRYSRYASNGTIDSIIKAALGYAFDADKEFIEWEKNPDNQADEETTKRRGPRTSAPPDGASAAAKK